MPFICYKDTNFHNSTMEVIDQANEIISDYAADGFDLTLRQLYYQFVARDLIPNKQKEYNRLGNIINKARMAGHIDWKTIEDRTRSLRSIRHFDDPRSLITWASFTYEIDMWENQDNYIEVWIEKDALTGVIRRICNNLDVPYFSCRGYVSQSEMWKASQRLRNKHIEGKNPIILHLGDHDPSGIHMSEDIEDRLNTLAIPPDERSFDWDEMPNYAKEQYFIDVQRIALNMPQIEELDPPPNPSKASDPRFESYMRKFGNQSWELDALEPKFIENLIRENIESLRDQDQWDEDKERLESDEEALNDIRRNYREIIKFLDNNKNGDGYVE